MSAIGVLARGGAHGGTIRLHVAGCCCRIHVYTPCPGGLAARSSGAFFIGHSAAHARRLRAVMKASRSASPITRSARPILT